MKSVLDLLKMDHKHLQHELCHPRRQTHFDNDSIQRKIQQVRQRKQQLRVQAQRKRSQYNKKQQRFEQYPLEQILQESLQVLQENTTLMIKQKMKFIQDKVYIGAKNNVNNEYINRIIDENQTTPVLKDELNLVMEDLLGNIQSDIVNGEFNIFNKKDIILQQGKNEEQSMVLNNPSKLINIKKVQLSNKIQELREQLTKTQLQQQKLIKSPGQIKKKSFSIRSANGSSISNSLNIDDFSIKSQKTKQAEEFVKKLQEEQTRQRKQRKKKQQQLRQQKIKQQQQRKQFQEQLKNEKHEKLKKKFQKQRQQKSLSIQKSNKAKQEYEKFLQEYRRRVPLYRQKQEQFMKKIQKDQKQRFNSVLSQIKQTKRSIDINELKQHQEKYKMIKKQSEEEKIANLKHRQKQIYLRHKQDKLYFRGRYHSLIKEEEEKIPQDPLVSVSDRLKKQKEFVEKVKKQYKPEISPDKRKQLDDLIQKINRNKPNKQTKDYHQIGNQYLADLHKLLKEIKVKDKVKVQLPLEIKPRYKNYLSELKQQRQYQTISYDKKDPEWIKKETQKLEQNIRRREKLLSLTEDIKIDQQMKKINDLDMDLLKSAQLKVKLLNQFNPNSQNDDEDQDEQQ